MPTFCTFSAVDSHNSPLINGIYRLITLIKSLLFCVTNFGAFIRRLIGRPTNHVTITYACKRAVSSASALSSRVAGHDFVTLVTPGQAR